MSQVGVKKFHLDKIESNSFILILNNKSKLVNNIITQLKDVQDGLIIDGVNPDTEEIAVELMTDHLKQQKQRLDVGDKTPSYLVLENCSAIQSVEFWKLLGKILRNRHTLNDTIIFCGDHTTVPDGILVEVDYCFLFRETSNVKLKQLYNDFGKEVFNSYSVFSKVYEQILGETEDSLILDYTQAKLNINNSVFWYKVI